MIVRSIQVNPNTSTAQDTTYSVDTFKIKGPAGTTNFETEKFKNQSGSVTVEDTVFPAKILEMSGTLKIPSIGRRNQLNVTLSSRNDARVLYHKFIVTATSPDKEVGQSLEYNFDCTLPIPTLGGRQRIIGIIPGPSPIATRCIASEE